MSLTVDRFLYDMDLTCYYPLTPIQGFFFTLLQWDMCFNQKKHLQFPKILRMRIWWRWVSSNRPWSKNTATWCVASARGWRTISWSCPRRSSCAWGKTNGCEVWIQHHGPRMFPHLFPMFHSCSIIFPSCSTHFPSFSIIFHHFPSFSIIFHTSSIIFHHFPHFFHDFPSFSTLLPSFSTLLPSCSTCFSMGLTPCSPDVSIIFSWFFQHLSQQEGLCRHGLFAWSPRSLQDVRQGGWLVRICCDFSVFIHMFQFVSPFFQGFSWGVVSLPHICFMCFAPVSSSLFTICSFYFPLFSFQSLSHFVPPCFKSFLRAFQHFCDFPMGFPSLFHGISTFPWDFHGISMGFPFFHHFSMGFPFFHHFSMGFPWDFHFSITFPWDFHFSITFPWDFHGISIFPSLFHGISIFPSLFHGISIFPSLFHGISTFPWDFHGISMGFPWDFHGISIFPSLFHGICPAFSPGSPHRKLRQIFFAGGAVRLRLAGGAGPGHGGAVGQVTWFCWCQSCKVPPVINGLLMDD